VEITAREATGEDSEALAGLAAAARSAVAEMRGGELLLGRELGGHSAAQAGLIAVGTVDGVVLGFASGRLETLPGGSGLMRLEAVWVDPAARGVGLGTELLAYVASWGAASGATGLDALVLPGDRALKNLFESAGLSARMIVMHRRLP
jgi:GNAT superfamily N-acetyltransferase